ncbi:M24 family metallopeptidase [Halothermothrix orenii]|uniref:Peptidase M24 n=1 Tax=Halothermothrix orenii (strain H 168 / OCM 544 / DSM 9562) TaxID=373903 RepID=B8D2E4_HALOH|nr:aminopeptidase P family protein [Halothermothrix orenii]ACL69371.1 peptidase M24 [Halothermothrix orenii H 168]
MEKRIQQLRKAMKKMDLDSLIIDSSHNRFYLTGFTGTAGRVLFTPENNYFITDFRYTEQAHEQISGFEILEVNQKAVVEISDILDQDNSSRVGFEARSVTYDVFQKYKKTFNESIKLVPTAGLVEKIRVVKDRSEVETIKKAAEIADSAFKHILDFIKPGVTEREVALELEYFMKKNGGEGNAFDFIVASGKRSSLPHGVASDKVIEDGDFVTMDFGTYYKGYCSDMTRTVIVGEPTPEQKEIYNIVLKAQNEVIKNIRAGMTCKEADAIARDIIAEHGYKDNFGHSLGHGLGVEVHEDPRVSYASDEVLKPGMVVTDEPGIYIADWGGVRIEDDLLITEDGCEVLTSSPKDLISV